MKTFKQFINESKSLTVYHGSKNVINDFKYEYTNKGNDQLGSGFYFTTDKDEAKGYGDNIHEVELTLTKTLDADKKGSMSFSQAMTFIKNAPDLEDGLSNWGDVSRKGKQKVMATAAQAYTFRNDNLVHGLFALANDFYGDNVEQFNRMIKKVYGYDSIVKVHENGAKHYVAFFPEQIKMMKVNK